jgi:hypothetical protein
MSYAWQIPLALVFAAYLMSYEFTASVEWATVLKIKGDGEQEALHEVMKTLVDSHKYGEWNSFTTQISFDGTDESLRPGASATLTVRLNFPVVGIVTLRDLPFEVSEVAKDRICWQYQMVPKLVQSLLLTTHRCMVLRTIHDATKGSTNVQIRHFDQNRGPLAPLVQVLFEGAIEEGFRRMTSDLVVRLS